MPWNKSASNSVPGEAANVTRASGSTIVGVWSEGAEGQDFWCTLHSTTSVFIHPDRAQSSEKAFWWLPSFPFFSLN
jgi:hypothetical protein